MNSAAPGALTDPAAAGRGEQLIDHILSHHHAYLRRNLPNLEGLLARMGSAPAVLQGRLLLSDLSGELMLHMEKEEQILFPTIVELEQALRRGFAAPHGCGVEGPILQMQHEHRDALELVERLIQLVPSLPTQPGMDPGRSIGELASDLREHIRLEEEELFPLARELAGLGGG